MSEADPRKPGVVVVRQLRSALVLVAALTLVTGCLYPLAVGALAQALFPFQAHGSLVRGGAVVTGSDLIGQAFTSPDDFWPRPSATSTPYDASSSSGSNLGPTSPALAKAVADRMTALRAAALHDHASIPVDLVTASGSGLDPDISVAAARYQAARVAEARGISTPAVLTLIGENTTGRQFGFLGEPRVNVLHLNRALDARYPRPAGALARRP